MRGQINKPKQQQQQRHTKQQRLPVVVQWSVLHSPAAGGTGLILDPWLGN